MTTHMHNVGYPVLHMHLSTMMTALVCSAGLQSLLTTGFITLSTETLPCCTCFKMHYPVMGRDFLHSSVLYDYMFVCVFC